MNIAMIQLCSLIILVIIVLILTGYVTPNFNNNGSILKKEGYGAMPPGMHRSISVSDCQQCRTPIASPSKEWLDWFYNGKSECWPQDPKRYSFATLPLEFQASTASSISNFIERVA